VNNINDNLYAVYYKPSCDF